MTSETFTQTAGQIITNALRDARIIAAEQPIQAKDLIDGLQAINMIIKHWQAQGIHLWSEIEAVLPLIPAQRKYLLGPDGDDIGIASTFFNTTVNADQIALDTVITLTATSGLTTDGQDISISGAPDILATNPATSTQDWTTFDGAIITASLAGLNMENGGSFPAGSVEYSLDTTIGVTYQVDIDWFVITNGAIFSVEDSNGILDSLTTVVSGQFILTFTARDITTVFSWEGTLATMGAESLLVSLNFRDKASGDRIGIELDDGSRFWDNVVTVDSSTQVTINNGIPSAATTANVVYTYSTAIARPMRLLQSRFAETITASEIPVRQWSRDEYFDQPDKDSSGTVVNWYYTPTLTIGQLFVWQVANDINQVLRFTYVDPIEIPTDTSDMLDVPSEWYMPLKWSIAAELGPSRGLPDNRQVILESKAAVALQEALAFDVERESLSFQPDFR